MSEADRGHREQAGVFVSNGMAEISDVVYSSGV